MSINEIDLKHVFIDGSQFKHVPEILKTRDLCEKAVEYDGITLKYIPKNLITNEMCEKAVSTNGYSLEYVPNDLKTYKICEMAVLNEIKSTEYVSTKFREMLIINLGLVECINRCLATREMYEKAVLRDVRNIQYMPHEYITIDQVTSLVKLHGNYLSLVPIPMRTYDVCLEACKNAGTCTFSHIPYEHRTYEMYKAVKCPIFTFEQMPPEFKTREMCEKAVSMNGYSLKHVPKDLITKEMCEKAVSMNGYSLKHVPKEFITIELLKEAVSKMYSLSFIMSYIDTEYKIVKKMPDGTNKTYITLYKTKDEICTAIKHNPDLIQIIPEELIDEDMIKIALLEDGNLLQHVKVKTLELCLLATSRNGHVLKYVPPEFKTRKLCKQAVELNAKVLKYIPEEFKDAEMYKAAFSANEYHSSCLKERILKCTD